MKYKILLKSFLTLALIITFSAQIYASEVTGNLSSSNSQGQESDSDSEVGGTIGNGTMSGNVGGGSSSEVGGTLGNGTISGEVADNSSSGGGGGGSSRRGGNDGGGSNGGSVLGDSTSNGGSNSNTPTGQVLGASTDVPGFPTTGLGLLTFLDSVLLVLVLTLLLFGGYSLYKKPTHS